MNINDVKSTAPLIPGAAVGNSSVATAATAAPTDAVVQTDTVTISDDARLAATMSPGDWPPPPPDPENEV